MNEQDTAAADAILLMEAEEKVKLRIAQVVMDMILGHPNSVPIREFNQAVYDARYNLQRIAIETIKSKLI